MMSKDQNILIVDDEEGVRDLLTLVLGDDYHVDTADCVPAAMEHMSHQQPSIIVSDIKMPGEDGMSLLAKVKSLYPQIPVIMITGHGDEKMAQEAKQIGAYGFLTKPFSNQILVEKIREALETGSLQTTVAA